MKSFKLTINEERKTNTIYMLLDEVDELQIPGQGCTNII